jgi:hypothetical protein
MSGAQTAVDPCTRLSHRINLNILERMSCISTRTEFDCKCGPLILHPLVILDGPQVWIGCKYVLIGSSLEYDMDSISFLDERFTNYELH